VSIYYRQSMTHQAMRRLLPLVGSVLPGWLFEPAFRLAFATYRGVIRLLYLRFLIAAVVTMNGARARKVLSVFRVMPYSLVGWRGLEATYDVVHTVLCEKTPGDLVECGVARGGSAALMGILVNGACDRRLWLFDSYEGLPDPSIADYRDGATGSHLRPLPKGSCLGTYEAVEDLLFSQLRLSKDRVFMVKGWFQDTLPPKSQEIGDISVLRIDADWYESVLCCLEVLYDHVLPHGFLIIDDYGSCYGAQRAVDEFLTSRNIAVALAPDGRGGVYFKKPSAS